MTKYSNAPRMPIYEVRKRVQRFRGKTAPEKNWKRISVVFDRNIGRFTENTAYALRRWIKYDSNRASSAKGLVQDSDPNQSFYWIHNRGSHYWGWQNGQIVTIWARLHRVVSNVPTERWVIFIEFDRDRPLVVGDGENVETDIGNENGRIAAIKSVLDKAADVAAGYKGKQGLRLQAYVKLAREAGVPGLFSLWHYQPFAVSRYLRADADYRAKIERINGVNGEAPFKGRMPDPESGKQQTTLDWRVYPFVGIVQNSLDPSRDGFDVAGLELIDEQIKLVGIKIREVTGITSIGGGSKTGPHVKKFIDHLVDVTRQRDNFHHIFEKI